MRNGPYELVVAPDNYPGKRYRGRYVYEHHLVWWQHTGVVVGNGNVVHHKNGCKRDNRIDNLEEKSFSAHAQEHGAALKKHPIELSCTWCGVKFFREWRAYNYKATRGQVRFFCSISHAARYQFSIPG